DASREAFGRRAQEAAEGSRSGEGLLGAEEVLLPLREGAGRPLAHLRVPRPQEQEAHVPPALDHAHQRGRTGERPLVQPVHRGPEEGGDRARPQGLGRSRRRGSTGLRRDRRAGQNRSAGLIRSRDNEKLKLVRKLHERRWRDKLALFFVEGEDLVDAARAGGFEAGDVLVAGENVEPAPLAQVSTLGHPPRVIGVFRRGESAASAGVSLALWRVSDPGNVGTLLRSADAFGAGVMLSDGCADPFGPKALRAGMGSTLRVPLPKFELRGAVALVADGGVPLSEVELERYSTFVLGAERDGLPDEILAQCDLQATIPVQSVESLNVAMAGTITLYERSRRSRPGP